MTADVTRLSQSGFQTARDCKRKYHYRYNLGLQRRGEFSEAMNFGKLWHSVLAEWFKRRTFDGLIPFIAAHAVDQDALERVSAMLTGYVAKYPEFPVCSIHEFEIEVPIRNPATGRPSRRFVQFGFGDMLALHEDGKVCLWEHKTASQMDGTTVEKLWSDSQITGYVAALRDSGVEVESVVYDIAVKPRLRQKKTESLEEFYQRIQDWHLTEPTAYHREEVYISERQIADWREDVWQVTQELLNCRRNGYWYRNTGRCFDYFRPCEFVSLCQNGAPEALINAEYETRESPSDNHNTEPEKPVF